MSQSGQEAFDLTISRSLVPRSVLPDYDPERVCPKCGLESRGIASTYHDVLFIHLACGVYYYAHRDQWDTIFDFPEHLCRTCTRCHFSWPEAILEPFEEAIS